MSGGPGFFERLEPGRKGEILDAALAVFGQSGYAGGTMRAIAERVGVSEPALYRHFAGKEAILRGLMRVAGGRARAEALALIDGMTADGLHDELVAALRDRREALAVYGPIMRIMLNAAAADPKLREEWRALMIEPIRAALGGKAAQLDEAFGVADGAADRDDRVRALLALFVGFMLSSAVLGDQPDEAIANAAMRVMGWA